MDDGQIIELFWERSEKAIYELGKKYEGLCQSLSFHILNNHEDAEECVSDAYRIVWESIPPDRPNSLAAYISKIVRNVSLTRYQRNTAEKRNSIYEVSLQELGEVFGEEDSVDAYLAAKDLVEMIEDFLDQQSRENRVIFVQRYSFFDDYETIAKRVGLPKKTVSVRLVRLRRRLKKYLKERGVTV